MSHDLEFTGERFVPGIAGEIAHEHWHRYAFARRYVAGQARARRRMRRRLWQRAAGGASRPTSSASTSTPDADRARAHRYAARRQSRVSSRAPRRAAAPGRSVDVVVSFETIEHLPRADQPRMLAEIARVLAPGWGAGPVRAQPGRVFAGARLSQSVSSARARSRGTRRVARGAFPVRRWYRQRRYFGSARVERRRHGSRVETWSGERRGHRAGVAARRDVFRRAWPHESQRGAAVAGRGAVAVHRSRRGRTARGIDAQAAETYAAGRAARGARRAARPAGGHVRHLEDLAARSASVIVVERDAPARSANAARAQPRATRCGRTRAGRAVRARDEAGGRAALGAAGGGGAWRRVRAPRARDGRTGAHHRLPPERPLVACAALAALPAVVAAHARANDERQRRLHYVSSTSSSRSTTRRTICALRRQRARALRPDVRLVLIDDASPDPRIAAVLRRARAARACRRWCCCATRATWASRGRRTAACALSRADVVLLNSDTIVTRGWLDALMHCAATDPTIGTITPFSNNAEICSFPRFCENNPWPAARDAGADARGARCGGRADVSRPADRRGLLPLHPARAARRDRRLRPGVRAGLRRGKRPVPARGARRLAQRARATTRSSCIPAAARSRAEGRTRCRATWRCCSSAIRTISTWCASYIAADPLRPLREAAAARLRASLPRPARGVLHVIHHHGGGTETHVRALIAGVARALAPLSRHRRRRRWQVEEHRADGSVVTFEFDARRARTGATSWAASARRFGIALIHLHNISGVPRRNPDGAGRLPRALRLHGSRPQFRVSDDHVPRRPTACTAAARPTLRVCTRCLARAAEFAGCDIAAWRERHRRAAAARGVP